MVTFTITGADVGMFLVYAIGVGVIFAAGYATALIQGARRG